MQLKQLSLTHLAAAAREPDAEQPPLLILAHGVGANEQDLMGLAPYADPRFMVISVRAPRRYQYGGFSWFDINWQASGFSIDTAQAVAGWELLQRFTREAVAAYGADPARVYLAGFSQGAITSLGATLTDPGLVAGTVVMSGRWMPEIAPQTDQAAIAGKPLLVVHGEQDNVIPVRYGREIRDYLQTLPVELTYREYRMGHEVSMDSLHDVTVWLRDQLDAGAKARQ
jgi:phospholipase/carboxylesterase